MYSAFDIGIDVFVLQRFQPKTLVQIDDRNDFPAQIDDPFDVIRRIRDGTYILYFYDFFYIHDLDAVYFIAELKRYELKLGIFSGHMCSLKAVFVIIYHIYTFCNIQSAGQSGSTSVPLPCVPPSLCNYVLLFSVYTFPVRLPCALLRSRSSRFINPR